MKQSVLSILCLLLVSWSINAQQKSIQFDKFTLEDGLSQSSITSIVQDNFGFIWVSTQDGINRYDGYSFLTFKSEQNNESSIPNNYIHCLTKDSKGDIWFGTNRGIGKINPKTLKITRYNNSILQDVGGYIYTQLTFDKHGHLWLLSEKNGIIRIDLETNEVTAIKQVLGNSEITAIHISNTDELWVGSQTGQIYYASPPYSHFKDIDYNSIFTIAKVNQFYYKQGFPLLITTERGLFSVDEEHRLQTISEAIEIRYRNINTVYSENRTSLWVGTADNGLYLLKKSADNTYTFSDYKKNAYDNSTISDNNISAIFEDKEGVFWIGTNKGLSKFDKFKQGFTTISLNNDPEKGLIDYNVWSFAEDKEGNMYIGTEKDLTIYDKEEDQFRHIIRDRNDVHFLLSIYVENENKIWLGYDDGLYLLKIINLQTLDYTFQKIDFLSEEIKRDVRTYSIVPTDTNHLWVGSRAGLTYINKDNLEYKFYESNGEPNSPGQGSVKIVYQDLNNNTWIVSSNMGLYRIEKSDIHGHNFIYYKIENHNEANAHITCMLQTKPGIMWLGTYGEGIKKLDIVSGKVKTYTEKEGLSNNVIYGLLEDNDGNLWVSTNKGISKFNPQTEKFSTFSTKDGLQSNEFNTNAYHKNQDGQLYFGGINGYNIFDPRDITINPHPPVAIISRLILAVKGDQNKEIIARNITTTEDLTLEYDQNDLAFEFAASNFSEPSKNKFKYILEGHETEYTYLENENKVHYMNIANGSYTFKLYAQSADGIWSREATMIHITITPPFWLTWWFRIMAGLILIIFGVIFYRRRVDKIRRQKVRLEIEVVKRTRQVTEQSKKIQDQKQKVEIQKAKIEHSNELLEKEKEKVEQLLLNILPVGTAEELKNKGRSKARYYKNVSVLFTDFVGFSKIAEDMKPQELVQQLDDYFSAFDGIIEKYDLEKIKTIGDSYMCAGGVPIRNKSNAIEVTLAALEIKTFMHESAEKAKKRGEKSWSIRIGINTGEVIAGVIGLKRFAYDIWGSTVNQAQRMEMHGQPGTVNVSGNTYEYIAPYFDCVYRGKIQTKHKGLLDMYYVKGIKPELSVDKEGFEPNDKFWKIVDLHLYSSINYMKAERHIMKLLEDELSPKLLYHSINHTIDVTQAVERLAIMEGITDEDLFLLKSAATYHDAGFVEKYDKNEEIGIKMAREILPKYGYTTDQLNIIDGLIKSTEIPQSPKTHLEQIMCDADLDYLGRDDFHVIADYLRRELREHGKLNSDRTWDEIQIKFLNQHTYFTASAIQLRQAKKEKHIREIEERYARNEYKD